MPELKSENFGRFFIIEFTKEILRAMPSYMEFVIQEKASELSRKTAEKKPTDLFPPQVRKDGEKIFRGSFYNAERKKIISNKIAEEAKRQSMLRHDNLLHLVMFNKPGKRYFSQRVNSPQRISESELPEQARLIKPIPTAQEIDLGKLNVLIRDSKIRTIECIGADENIIVEGIMGRKNTSIFLNEDEIMEVIKKFSDASKIPLNEGVMKIVFGKLILFAVFSELVSSKFIIKKMFSPRNFSAKK